MEGWIGAVGERGRVGGVRGAPSGARRGVVAAAGVVRRLLLAVDAAQKGPARATRKPRRERRGGRKHGQYRGRCGAHEAEVGAAQEVPEMGR